MVLLASATSTTLWPGDFIEIDIPNDLPSDTLDTLELRSDIAQVRLSTTSEPWPNPNIVKSDAGKICIPNLTSEPIRLKCHQHSCQVHCVFCPPCESQSLLSTPPSRQPNPTKPSATNFSSAVNLDPANLLSPS